jgi:hypothetical protein
MNASEPAEALVEAELDFEDAEPAVAWYTPGLLRRIEERRRHRPERPRRLSIRERLRARGLHWSTELVVGVFVAVLVVSLATVALARVGAGTANDLTIPTHSGSSVNEGGGSGDSAGTGGTGGWGVIGVGDAPAAMPSATPKCIAAPIPGSAMRPCRH